jgi:hypothetical protein
MYLIRANTTIVSVSNDSVMDGANSSSSISVCKKYSYLDIRSICSWTMGIDTNIAWTK